MTSIEETAMPKILAMDVGGSHVKCLLSSETKRCKAFAFVQGFSSALLPEQIAVGAGQVDRLKKLPPRTRCCDNSAAFLGGFRLWDESTPLKSPTTYKDLS